jgi:hypothetical protein
MIYEQVPVRLLVNLSSNPPVDPIDANTGLPPRCWRGEAVSLQIGIFDPAGLPVDLSNLQYLQVTLQNAVSSLIPLVTKQVVPPNILSLTTAAWLDGSGQQAIVILDAADTDQGLGGLSSADFWIQVQGLTQAGAPLNYAAGRFTIFDPGQMLPPLVTTKYVSRNAQNLIAGNITAVPTSYNHTEVVTVSGVARTSVVILPIAGMADGALLRVRFNLPATANIIVQIASALVGNVVSTIQTGGVLSAMLEYYFDATAQAWVPNAYVIPATN